VKRDGTVTQLGGADAAAHLGLPRVAGELYRSARRLRVFVLGNRENPGASDCGPCDAAREEVVEAT